MSIYLYTVYLCLYICIYVYISMYVYLYIYISIYIYIYLYIYIQSKLRMLSCKNCQIDILRLVVETGRFLNKDVALLQKKPARKTAIERKTLRLFFTALFLILQLITECLHRSASSLMNIV